MQLKNVYGIIRFGGNVEIILQDDVMFADPKNNKTIFVKNDYSYGDWREYEQYLNYKVVGLKSIGNYLTIYIAKGNRN